MPEANKKKSSFWKNFFIVFTTFILTVILTLGVLGLYIFKANPFNVQACIISSFLNSAGSESDAQAETKKDKHPLLNTEQEEQLDNAGIDVESLPQTVSPETEKCFIEKLGEDRVKEIKAGDSPTTMEIFKARDCL